MEVRAITGGRFGHETIAETARRTDPALWARLAHQGTSDRTVTALKQQLRTLSGRGQQSVRVSRAFRGLRRLDTPRVLRGIVLARGGPFRSFRGQFNDEALARIVTLANGMADGLPCRWEHGADSEKWRLGAIRDVRQSGNLVLGNLHLSRENPDLMAEVLGWLSTTPAALSSSLQLGHTSTQPGNPRVWMPEALEACDLVRLGDASPTADLWPMENLDLVIRQVQLDRMKEACR